ncbi:MAG: hypothetical protein Q4F84_08245, partial [Fibrobacter sp.]|nr:hypothetical protein [Fibrobacter sp.]
NEHKKDSIMIAFDYNKGFYRFDRDNDKRNRSLRTPDYYYEYVEEIQKNPIVMRQSVQERTPSNFIQPFDIRNLGFFNFVGPYWEQEYTKNELEKFLKDKPLSFEESLSGVFTIMVEQIPPILDYPPFKRKYWIDSKQGYSLVRVEYGGTDTIEISWKEINRTWVPTSFRLSSTQQNNQSAEWKIDWLYVNETVPDDYFDPTLLSEQTTMLVSDELGELVVIGKIGKGIPLPEIMAKPPKKVSYFRYFLVAAGLIMILLALGRKIYDKKTNVS